MMQELLAEVLTRGIGLLIALSAWVVSAYVGIGLFDRLTRNIEEWKEIRKGNGAVGLLVATIAIAILWLTAPRIERLAAIFYVDVSFGMRAVFLLAELLNWAVTLVIAVFLVELAMRLFDYFTVGIDERKELARGNVAVALVLAALILGTVWITQPLVFQLVESLSLRAALHALAGSGI